MAILPSNTDAALIEEIWRGIFDSASAVCGTAPASRVSRGSKVFANATKVTSRNFTLVGTVCGYDTTVGVAAMAFGCLASAPSEPAAT
jgi:hypothetical protein